MRLIRDFRADNQEARVDREGGSSMERRKAS
jgi:hypothetical protein